MKTHGYFPLSEEVEKSGQGLKGMKGRMQLLFVSANISQS